MKIITCVRQTPDTETLVKIAGTGIEPDGVKFILGPYDGYALEAAAQIQEKSGGSVTAVTVGPDRATEMLRGALAVGAEKAVHIVDNNVTGDDALAVATALATQIKTMEYDLVFVSNKGTDSDRGAVSPMLAELLGVPYVGLVTEIEVESDTSLLVSRDVEGGAKERFRVTLPAVIGVQKGVRGEPRYAALPAIMKAKKKPIETVTVADVSAAKKTTVEKMEYPPTRPPGRKVDGDSAVAKARELVRLLRDEAKVL